MPLPKMIGICGYPLHGKSTAQRFLSLLGVEPRDDADDSAARVR
jgi:dephospho-CoA kinase